MWNHRFVSFLEHGCHWIPGINEKVRRPISNHVATVDRGFLPKARIRICAVRADENESQNTSECGKVHACSYFYEVVCFIRADETGGLSR